MPTTVEINIVLSTTNFLPPTTSFVRTQFKLINYKNHNQQQQQRNPRKKKGIKKGITRKNKTRAIRVRKDL